MTLQETLADEVQLTWELARYSVAEELVVHPVLERNMDHGGVIADKDRNETHQVSNGAIAKPRNGS